MQWVFLVFLCSLLLEYAKTRFSEKRSCLTSKVGFFELRLFNKFGVPAVVALAIITRVEVNFLRDAEILTMAIRYMVSVMPMIFAYCLFTSTKLKKKIAEKGDMLTDHSFFAGFLLFGSRFPWKTTFYSFYLLILILGQLTYLTIISIGDVDILKFIEHNRYSLIILVAIDGVRSSIANERKLIDDINDKNKDTTSVSVLSRRRKE